MFRTADIIIVSIFVLVQWRITARLLRTARKRLSGAPLAATRTAVVLFNVVLVSGWVLSFSQVLSYFNIPPRLGMVIGAISVSYLLLAAAILGMQKLFEAVDRRFWSGMNPERRRVLQTAARAAMAVPVAALGYGSFIERRNFRVREVDVSLPDLSSDLDGLRLVQLSDIHLSAFLSEAEFAPAIDAANELRPHLALITGDLISSRGDPLDACLRQLGRLKADAGVFGCMGNHERYADAEEYTENTAARLGVRFLRNHALPLRFGGSVLNLAGVDYQRRGERGVYLRGAERLLAPGGFNVLLSHNPDVFPTAARQGYNLLLAGHTHGGQVAVEILEYGVNPARFVTPYVYGLFRKGAAAGYVTRGIGTVGIPARICAPPEIALLRLRKA